MGHGYRRILGTKRLGSVGVRVGIGDYIDLHSAFHDEQQSRYDRW